MIWYSVPWSTEKKIGEYYNKFMEKLSSDDCAVFKDGDAMFTTDFFGRQIEDIVLKYPECGLFTAVANRIGCVWQREGEWKSDDIKEHRVHGRKLFDEKYSDIKDVSNVDKGSVLGGVLIVIRKSTWEKLGGFSEKGILGVDNDIHWRAIANSEKVYLMTGVYLYHWYRGGVSSDKKHLL